ncbi:hypothetical protein NM688_g4942 [Phlebia brevispora]|uniref:Uncharacterized protein n=1 Tax=Phlebia brevispora TaxID=194682 RepID=A0ACC1T230_9APHY|nr:hypothetical protein NM688_g4942 [Phlebia brevispora]
MLGLKAKLVSGKYHLSTGFSSNGGNTSSRLIRRCIRGGGALLRHANRRLYSSKGGASPDPFGGPEIPFHQRLANVWRYTPTKWYPLPVAVGALLLIVIQYRKRYGEREVVVDEEGREVVKLKGPWHVHVIGALPLRNLSRVWGYVNSLELPVWARPVGFRLYAWAFGCNLDEVEKDLKEYKSLGDFFYRRLKDGARPVADVVLGGKVEQVKGSTYSLDALLGVETIHVKRIDVDFPSREMAEVEDRTFADINGIDHLEPIPPHPDTSQPQLKSEEASASSKKFGERTDASVSQEGSVSEVVAHDASVAAQMGVRPTLQRRLSSSVSRVKPENALYFTVIYLAPGDYHRFHSPTAWVVEKRRHFVGDLFSVSPWMAKRLENLFVLNERVALLGRWTHGFFGMVPVGATNVGSIKINFDKDLRTNVGSRRGHPLGTYTEAVYTGASPVLGGQPLLKAQEMGGFCLGSTVVLVFEAPKDFRFSIAAGEKVKVGQALGDVPDAECKKDR